MKRARYNRRMLHKILVVITLALSCAAQSARQVEWTFDNRTHSRVDFYVDGHLACSANSMATCPSMEQDSAHHLEARQDGATIKTRDITPQEAADGGYNWGVCIINKTCPSN